MRRKKMLHILKSEPDSVQRELMCTLSYGYEILQYSIKDENIDYGEMVDLIFEYDEIICWW